MAGPFMVVERPALFPARCIVCGSHVAAPFVDTGCDAIDPDGITSEDGTPASLKQCRVYLCRDCVSNVMLARDVVPLEEHVDATRRLTEALNENVTLAERGDGAERRVAELERQLQRTRDQLQSANVNAQFMEARIAELSRDPASLPPAADERPAATTSRKGARSRA